MKRQSWRRQLGSLYITPWPWNEVSHTQLRVVLVTLFGLDDPTALAMRDANEDIMERDTELEEYNPRERGLKARLTASTTHWVQIFYPIGSRDNGRGRLY